MEKKFSETSSKENLQYCQENLEKIKLNFYTDDMYYPLEIIVSNI